ncbi:hypothetical protein D3C72_1480400 [compost metagenome]
MRQQLFQDQAFLRRMLALFQIRQLDIRRRAVQCMQRLWQAHQTAAQFRRQQFGNSAGIQQLQRLIGQLAQRGLAYAFGGGINRCQ